MPEYPLQTCCEHLGKVETGCELDQTFSNRNTKKQTEITYIRMWIASLLQMKYIQMLIVKIHFKLDILKYEYLYMCMHRAPKSQLQK